MLSKVTAVCALTTLAFTTTAIPQSGNVPSKGVRGGDSYAVYSAVIPMEHDAAKFARYVIAEQTVTAIAPTPGKRVRDCLAVASDEAREYEAAIADFEQKNSSSERLEPRLKLQKPYLLLNDVDVAKYRRMLAATWGFAPKDSQPDHRFDGGGSLITVSRVGFSNEGNIAIVYVQHECGSLCGGGGFHILRKQGDKWVEERSRCVWDS